MRLPRAAASPSILSASPTRPGRAECAAGVPPTFTGLAGSNCPAFTQAIRTSRQYRNRRLNPVPINDSANKRPIRRLVQTARTEADPVGLPDAQLWSTSLCGKRSRTASSDNGTWT